MPNRLQAQPHAHEQNFLSDPSSLFFHFALSALIVRGQIPLPSAWPSHREWGGTVASNTKEMKQKGDLKDQAAALAIEKKATAAGRDFGALRWWVWGQPRSDWSHRKRSRPQIIQTQNEPCQRKVFVREATTQKRENKRQTISK